MQIDHSSLTTEKLAGDATADADLQASLAMIDQGMAQIHAGEGISIEEARRQTLAKLRSENG